jgi:hypothetical protein
MDVDLNTEIDRNLFAFLPRLPELLPDHEGSFALLRHQRIQSIHEKLSDALKAADTKFADGLYSIQQITDQPIDLGFFSHASHPG